MHNDNDGHDNKNNNVNQPMLQPRRSARIRQRPSSPTEDEDEHHENGSKQQGEQEDQIMANVDYQEQEQGVGKRQQGGSSLSGTPAPGSPEGSSTTAGRRGGTRHGIQTENEDSQFVLRWVQDNYQYEQDHNVPRSGMYEHYRSTCERCNASPVNSATFGKLIRHVFPEISTRRLGTRGQSKYHYCGIRRRAGPNLAPPPPFHRSRHQQQHLYHAETASSSTTAAAAAAPPPPQQPPASSTYYSQPVSTRRIRATTGTRPYHRRPRPMSPDDNSPSGPMDISGPSSFTELAASHRPYHHYLHHHQQQQHPFMPPSSPSPSPTASSFPPRARGAFAGAGIVQHQQQQQQDMTSSSLAAVSRPTDATLAHQPSKRTRLGDPVPDYPSTPRTDLHLPAFTTLTFASQNDTMHEFAHVYEMHCTEILHMIRSGQFQSIYGVLVGFYHMLPDRFRTLIDEQPQAADAIWRWDCALYDAVIVTMLPTIQSPLSYEMNKALREYTRDLENYLSDSLHGYPDNLRELKTDVARIFVSKFRRHLKLNQMAQAAAALLRRPNTLEPMRQDWDRVDVASILDQTHWPCDCDSAEIRRILVFDITNLLNSEASLDHWISWMQGVVDRYMTTHQQKAGRNHGYLIFYAKQFMLKWSVYTSLIIKDMTLTGAKSIDQFRILTLFFDDMMQYLIEERLAKVMASSPFAQQPLTVAAAAAALNTTSTGGSSSSAPATSPPPSSAPAAAKTGAEAAQARGQQTSTSTATTTTAVAMLDTPPPSTTASSHREHHSQDQQRQQSPPQQHLRQPTPSQSSTATQ
ncbi:hypothetical protein BDB00DRAFT_855519 [Zychaea mexicana]|uniref:uncharacterized protein n=1 Tax=Zychaea mexicana TaxID=64656 RepID=UPI0022FF2424|nr:uncharacterized protein BDB00DRAFT_855519 [Zychaea mexicana]KAI9484449.1 hypothetical protein BDB00DRAFT_855519 [Zychaea mexicana]